MLSIVGLAEELRDDWDTWIWSRRYQSVFTWAFGKYSKTIAHRKSKLSELLVKSNINNTTDAFYSSVQKLSTSDNHLVFHAAFKNDRKIINQVKNNELDKEFDYLKSTSNTHLNDAIAENETIEFLQDDSIPPPSIY